MRDVSFAFLALDTHWEDPAEKFVSFSYAARKVEASLRSAPDLGHVRTRIVDLSTEDPQAFVEAVDEDPPSIVAASTYIWSVKTFLETAKLVKERHPETRVVMGGPSARTSLLSLPRYKPYARYIDAIVPGEGEEVIRDLARDPQGDWSTIPGLILPHALGFRSTEARERPELDAFPSPYQLDLGPKGHTGFIETFRGCPIACAFCQWGDQRSDRVHSAEYLTTHLEGLARAEAPNLFLVDAALNLSGRAFRNLMEAERRVGLMKSRKVSAHLYPTHLRPEHLEFLDSIAKAKISIGIQSFDPEVLKKLGRPFDLDRFEAVLRELKGRIPIDLEIIIGLPGDNPDSFRRTLDRCMEIGDTIRVFYPLVLPDALLERAQEFAIDFDPDTFMVRSCVGWSEADLRREWEGAIKRTEGMRNRILHRALLGFSLRDFYEKADEPEVSTSAVRALRDALSRKFPSWVLLGASRADGSVRLDLDSPGGEMTVSIKKAAADERCFVRFGQYAYTHQRDLPSNLAPDLRRVIQAVHEAGVGNLFQG